MADGYCTLNSVSVMARGSCTRRMRRGFTFIRFVSVRRWNEPMVDRKIPSYALMSGCGVMASKR